jgi:hypothetical protein
VCLGMPTFQQTLEAVSADINRTACETGHLFPYSEEVKNWWRCYLHSVVMFLVMVFIYAQGQLNI